MSTPFLQIRHIVKRFGRFTALDDVSLDVEPGSFTTLLGPSGCGKTTLLRIIAGLERQDAGTVAIRGHDVSRLPVAARNCGIVFQSYALFPNLTATDNIAYGMKVRGIGRAARRARVRELLDLVGLPRAADQYPAQLSGGEQQRVALARALSVSPDLLLLDEPLSALDARVRARLRGEIRRIHERMHITTLMVTHDQEEALVLADRIVVMNAGRLVQNAVPHDVYRVPASPFVADFIGSMNFLAGWRAAGPDAVARGPFTLLTGRPHDAPDGTPVTLAIRPEDIHLPDRPDAANTLPGLVEQIEFRGAFFRVRIRLDGHDAPLEADIRRTLVEKLGLRAGVPLAVSLPPGQVLVFPDLQAVPA